MVMALVLAVVRPSAFCENPMGRQLIDRYGWAFIAVRWLYYSAVFTLFRDYQGAWRPFVEPPFGLSLERYAALQRRLSVVFGFLLMGAITGSLELYLRLRGKVVPPLTVMNVLGVTFFFPFVPLQLLDLAALLRRRWTMAVIIPLHSLVLLWEAVATMAILGKLYQLGVRDRVMGVGLIVGSWIGVARPLWR